MPQNYRTNITIKIPETYFKILMFLKFLDYFNSSSTFMF